MRDNRENLRVLGGGRKKADNKAERRIHDGRERIEEKRAARIADTRPRKRKARLGSWDIEALARHAEALGFVEVYSWGSSRRWYELPGETLRLEIARERDGAVYSVRFWSADTTRHWPAGRKMRVATFLALPLDGASDMMFRLEAPRRGK